MLAKIRRSTSCYGFDPVETPAFEYTDCLGKFLPDTDRPNAGVFSVQDDDEQWMSLRYDLTAPLARHVSENINEIQLPYRTYRAGWVFRNEKPGPGGSASSCSSTPTRSARPASRRMLRCA
jgi:histidyl-tRNA synthetase